MKNTVLAIFTVLLAAHCPANAANALKIGDPAPPIKVARWFKGDPGEKPVEGTVQVVEFWATWCGPCMKSIPHLSELSKKYQGKARIIGISIWESEKTDHEKRLAAVGKFVESQGDKMDYAVAADDNDGSMASKWMEAAGEKGIPTAFIVGKDGRIVWVGNPWEGLDDVLERTVNGNVDTKAVAAQAEARQKAKDDREAIGKLYQPVNDLAAAGKHTEAIALLDSLVSEHPELKKGAGFTRYRLLKAYDQPAAWQQARTLLEGDLKDNPNGLYQIARDLTDPPGPATKDYPLALAISQRMVALTTTPNSSYLSTLAESHAGLGDFSKAIETEELALKSTEGDSPTAAGSRKYLERRLEAFRKAAAKAKE